MPLGFPFPSSVLPLSPCGIHDADIIWLVAASWLHHRVLDSVSIGVLEAAESNAGLSALMEHVLGAWLASALSDWLVVRG
jgi:hypothetical protein